jgi:uncharacterized protein YecE (DUF72 family)
MTHVFEFRDPDWFREDVRRILARSDLSLCIYDMVDHPCPLWVTSPTIYLRFHGAAVKYGGCYGEGRLKPWTERIREWDSEGRQVSAYFNNDLGGFALEDAQTLRRLLGR